MNINQKIEELNEIMIEIEKCQIKENNMAISSVDNNKIKEYKNKEVWGIPNISLRFIGCGILSAFSYLLVNMVEPIAKAFEYVPFWYVGVIALSFMYFSHQKSKESRTKKYKEIFELYSVEQESIKLLMLYNLKFTELNNEIKIITKDKETVDILEDFKSTLKHSLAENNGKLKTERFNRYIKNIVERHSKLSGYNIRERSKEIVETIESELRTKNKYEKNNLNKENVIDNIKDVVESDFSNKNELFEINSNKELSISVNHLTKKERLEHATRIVDKMKNNNIPESKTLYINLTKKKEYVCEE